MACEGDRGAMTTPTGLRSACAVVAIACVAALTGCGSAVGKSGAPATATTVIRLGAADTNNAQLLFFASKVDTSSHHRIHIDIDLTTYFSETPGGEAKLAEALEAGKVDLGYLPSRDWAQAGATGFAALQTPGLLTTTAQEVQLSRDPIATELLSGLSSEGVVGLGLIPDEVRRLITRKPLLGADDLHGARIRIGDSTRTAAMIGALGATAVQGLTAGQTKQGLLRGDLDGVETGATPASQNGYNGPAPYLTSFGVIPKFEVLAANAGFWKRLSSADQRSVQSAATATVEAAATEVPAREANQLQLMCANGLVIVRPTTEALSRIRAVADESRPTDAADTALIARIAAAAGTTGPQADASPVPTQCAVAGTAAAAKHRREAAPPTASSSSAHPKLLVGTYKNVVTAQDWAAGGARGVDASADVTFIWTLSADGSMTETQKPDYPDQGPVSGTWTVHGDQLVFDFDQGTDHFHQVVRWSYFQGELSFTPIAVQDVPSKIIFSVPWHKTG